MRKGDRVAVLLRNSTDYIALFLAVARAGAMSVRLNWRLTAPEIEFALTDSGSTVLIFDDEFADRVVPIRGRIPVRHYVVHGQATAADWATPFGEFANQPADPGGFPEMTLDDPATLMYTSGTTGRPKGAVLTHGNELWIGSIAVQRWGVDQFAVAQTSGPLFHAGGFEALLLPAMVSHGTAITFPSGGFDLGTFLDTGTGADTTHMLLYSFMLADLLRMPDLEQRVPASLKRIVTGGDTVMPWVYEEFERRLPGIEIFQSYGLTEGGAISASLDHWDAKGHESSVGRPQAMTEVKITRLDGSIADVEEVGEICVRSPGVSPGYWQLPEVNEVAFAGGWCRTGDLGRVDKEGFLYLAGRSKDMYRSGGENVYPAEIEKVLTAHDDIADAAVIGVPDPKFVEVGAAVIVAKAGRTVDPEVVRAYCADRLAKFKTPRYFIVVNELPRNANGKVVKTTLRAQYAGIGETAAGVGR